MNSLAGNESLRGPANDEVEVSTFGPGYGETVIVHLGLGDWLIVDSCINKSAKIPAGISYLRKLGINPSNAVKIVLASHWHDDHIRGLASVFEECQVAQFFCAASLRAPEFLTLVRLAGARSVDQGVQEFAKIIELLRERSASKKSPGPQFAVENTRLWLRDDHGLRAEVFALSPSSASVNQAFNEISQLIPSSGQPKRRLVPLRPNHAAVVLSVTVGDQSIILGSDLEETTDPLTGWSVIVDSTGRSTGRAQVFKIPHHGSENGHQSRVWSEMLDREPVAVLTPFINGGIALPTRPDVRRISLLTPNAFSTAQLQVNQQKRRRGALERTIKEVVRSIRIKPNVPGHIRLRKRISDASDPWRIELFDGAVQLRDAIA